MGMQSHWVMDYPSISMFEKSIRRYAALGLEIQLTELDIRILTTASGLWNVRLIVIRSL